MHLKLPRGLRSLIELIDHVIRIIDNTVSARQNFAGAFEFLVCYPIHCRDTEFHFRAVFIENTNGLHEFIILMLAAEGFSELIHPRKIAQISIGITRNNNQVYIGIRTTSAVGK